MRLYQRLANSWPVTLAAGLALGALALLWRVRDTPLALDALARIDALSAFFMLALCGGAALALLARAAAPTRRWWRPVVAAAALILAFSTTSTLAIAGAYLLAALLTHAPPPSAPARAAPRPPLRSRLARAWRRVIRTAPGLVAASCLLLGYGALATRGAAQYDDRTAGEALDSFAFWFVLLASIIACSPLFTPPTNDQRPTTNDQRGNAMVVGRWLLVETELFRFAWLYPLARLYSLGPWNSGWSFATLLLGGALALWHAGAALAEPTGAARGHTAYLALALAGLGLSTSAGIAVGCYGILTYLVLIIGAPPIAENQETRKQERRDDHRLSLVSCLLVSWSDWLLSSAIPLTAPFVAAWMLMGAGVAGGVALLAGAAWLVALLHALADAVWIAPWHTSMRRTANVAAAASVALGVGATLAVRWLIQPVVAQLQGGLTPYGDVNIWPWVGLATSDAAHTQVTTLPSIAIALLMLVLSALVYVVARLRALQGGAGEAGAAGITAPEPMRAILDHLRAEVPWLGALRGPDPRGQGHRGDGE